MDVTLFLLLQDKDRLRMSGNTSLRFIFESKTKRERKQRETGENGTVESFIVCTMLFAKYNLDDQTMEK
jgi:hypothetical protein